MRNIQRSKTFTDVNYAQLTRIADQLRSNAEDLAFSTTPPTFENCRIAGAMVGWAFNLVPMRVQAKFDY